MMRADELNEVPDADLTREIKARAARKAEEREKAAVRLSETFRHKVTRDALDALVPEHGRTSCSDDNRRNGFGSNGSDFPRCNRCALLDVLDGTDNFPPGIRVSLVLEVT
jgi:hypothetical protein